MKCPSCPDTTLLMTERQRVEIDYCPNCRGVWLDRGELDKLVALSGRNEPAPQPSSNVGHRPDFADSDFGKRHGSYRRKSWLSEFFD